MAVKEFYNDGLVTILQGDVFEALVSLQALSVQTCITSPPYWRQRIYMAGDEPLEGQIGQEYDWRDYVETMFRWGSEVRRVLKGTGTLWLNMGNRYGGSAASTGQPKWESARDLYSAGTSSASGVKDNVNKPKNLMGIPYRLVFRLTDEQGWLWRNEIPWHKPNAMCSPKTDALTPTWEPFFLLAKSSITRFRLDRIRVPHRKSSWLRIKAAEALRERTGSARTAESASAGHQESSSGPTARLASMDAGLHPLGKNPGDVFGVKIEDLGLRQPPEGSQLSMFDVPEEQASMAASPDVVNPITERLYSPDWKGGQHPQGSNPGDVMSSEYKDWYDSQREKKGFHGHENDAVRGQHGDSNYAPVLTHPGGAAPPDVIDDSFEFYSDPEDFWSISTAKGQRRRRSGEQKNYASFPEAVCVIPILASTDPLDLVLDPFGGTGTVGVVAKKLGRRCVLIELNPKDCDTAAFRINEVPTPMEVYLK